MGIKKRLGKARAEKAVMVIELAKAFMRLLLLRETKGRMGVNPAVPEREVDPSILDQQKKLPPIVLGQPPHASVEFPRSSADVLLGVQGEEGAQQDYWVGSRTGLTRPTLASIQPPADLLLGTPSPASGKDVLHQYLLTRVLTAEDVKKPQDLVSKVHGLGRLAEIVWILRPVIYVVAMKKYGRRHTFPFLLSLSLEYLSYSLRESSRNSPLSSDKASGPMLPSSTSDVEKGESSKRARKFWWYFLRGPVWDTFTKPKLEGISNSLETKPLVGFVATLVRDYLPLIDDYHFYAN